MNQKTRLAGLGVLLLLLDLLSKAATVRFLPPMSQSAYSYPYGGVGVFKNVFGIEFSLSFTTNTGAAWGAFGDYQLWLLAFRVIVTLGLLAYFFYSKLDWTVSLPLMTIITGATGNVIDYFLYGHVIDMLHFVLWGYDFPVFNLADTYISLGVVGLLLLSWLKDRDYIRVGDAG